MDKIQQTVDVKLIGDESLIPLNTSINFGAIGFILTNEIDEVSSFFNYLAQATTNNCDFGFVDLDIRENDIIMLRSGLAEANLTIITLLPLTDIKFDDDTLEKVKNIIRYLSDGKKLILIVNNYSQHFNINSELTIILPDTKPISIISGIMKITGRELESN